MDLKIVEIQRFLQNYIKEFVDDLILVYFYNKSCQCNYLIAWPFLEVPTVNGNKMDDRKIYCYLYLPIDHTTEFKSI